MHGMTEKSYVLQCSAGNKFKMFFLPSMISGYKFLPKKLCEIKQIHNKIASMIYEVIFWQKIPWLKLFVSFQGHYIWSINSVKKTTG